MKHIRQFGIIMIVTFLGEVLKDIIPLQIPASIYGLILMLIALKTKLIPLDSVSDAGKFMIEIMPLMFIPAAVGLMDSWQTLRSICIPVLIITFLSTIAVMVASGRITQFVIRLEKGKE
jgi:Putative effector of murein hydrolase LrgA